MHWCIIYCLHYHFKKYFCWQGIKSYQRIFNKIIFDVVMEYKKGSLSWNGSKHLLFFFTEFDTSTKGYVGSPLHSPGYKNFQLSSQQSKPINDHCSSSYSNQSIDLRNWLVSICWWTLVVNGLIFFQNFPLVCTTDWYLLLYKPMILTF